MSAGNCTNCGAPVEPDTKHIVRRAGFMCHVLDLQPRRLKPSELVDICLEYVRIRNEQDPGREHGPPLNHYAVAECFEAWRLAFASVGAKL